MPGSPLLIICLIGLVDLSSFGLIIPLLPTYAHRFGVNAAVLGMMLGCYSLAQFCCAPLLGRWSDRIGRRPVLLASIAGSVASHALLGVADLSASIPLLFLARVLDGMTGANIATAQAYIADVTTGTERARGMGLFGAMIGLGFVIGPIFGGLLLAAGTQLVGPAGTSWPAFGASLVSLVALVLVWKWLPEARRVTHSPARTRDPRQLLQALPTVVRNAQVRQLLMLFSVLTCAFVFLEATFVYLCHQRFRMGEQQVMFVFAYFGMLMVVVRGGMVGRLAKRYGEPLLCCIGPFISAAGFLMIAASSSGAPVVLLLGACLPIALGTGITEPSIHALLSRQSGAQIQGLTLGVATGLASLMRGLVPLLAGALYDVAHSLPYWIAGLVYVLAGCVALLFRRSQQQALAVSKPGSAAGAMQDACFSPQPASEQKSGKT